MKNYILISIMAVIMNITPFNAFAEDNTTVSHKMTFLDFNGNVMQTIEVSEGEKIDYSQIDTSSLHEHIDRYTEQDFNMWSATPETIASDTTVQALYKKATISVEGTPNKTEYYTPIGEVKLDGLSVTITLEIQTPITDENGDYYINKQTENIIKSCHADKKLDELFANGKTAEVNIIPIGDDKSIFTYEITLFDSLGDANSDGIVDAVDASFILQTYADLSTGEEVSLDDEKTKIYDVNRDTFVNANDAGYILTHYSLSSTGGTPVWEEIVPELA